VVEEIPVIDFAPCFSEDEGALGSLACEVAHACDEIGFFYALNHGIPAELIGRAFTAARHFFALPLEQKMALRLDQSHFGYLPIGVSVRAASAVHHAARPNRNESFFVSEDRHSNHREPVVGTPSRCRNEWPADLPECGLI
jgi:isopenicillin N synthase-like dioxygenase